MEWMNTKTPHYIDGYINPYVHVLVSKRLVLAIGSLRVLGGRVGRSYVCSRSGSVVQVSHWASKDETINWWFVYYPMYIINPKLNSKCIIKNFEMCGEDSHMKPQTAVRTKQCIHMTERVSFTGHRVREGSLCSKYCAIATTHCCLLPSSLAPIM
jgi:hypothetical protein